jgi:hypothetical protein
MRTSGLLSCRRFIRVLAVVPVLASFTVIGSATKVGPSIAGCAQASYAHHAALVVEHGDAAVVTVCVSFTEDSITGDQLLARSGVQYATADYGSTGKAVCQIDSEPVQYPPGCWTASSPYWAMFVSRGGGSWAMSSLGISSQTFRDGDAEGFRYEGQSDYSVPPSPRGVCPVPGSPTATPHPAATPAASRAATHGAPPPSSLPSGTAEPNAAASASPVVGEPVAAVPTSSATARPTIASSSQNPPSDPVSFGAGAWAAFAVGAVFLVLLVRQVMRARRQALPPRTNR